MKPLLAVLLTAQGAMADVPSPDYFAGVYEQVGRSADPKPVLIDRLVRLSPVGSGLALSICGEAADTPPTQLEFDRFGDVRNLLATAEGAEWLGCQFFNDMDNNPVLNCHDGKGGLFTLWPAADKAAKC